MAAEIGLLSVTQIQKLSQPQHQHHHQNHPQPHQPNPNSTASPSTTSSSIWMWNPREHQEDDDSWEVRAFAEDTRNIMDTTWPPRSYTCTFCRREFRSAQALGGHMNVHRRDRARLHHHQPPNPATSSHHSTSSSFTNIPPQELAANGGLCLLYHLPTSPNDASFSAHSRNTTLNACGKSPSNSLLNVSSYPPNYWERAVHAKEETAQIIGKNKHLSFERIREEQNIRQANLMMVPAYSPSFDFPMAQAASNGFSSYCYSSSSKVEEPTATSSSTNHGHHEELDLELRLGHKSTPT